jgi:geranylgeranyl reductase family protein
MQGPRGARYDVVVVGAGPAGSTAARECAARGLSTALLDRAEFPRDKPCGGGVTARAAALLPFDIDPVVEQRVRDIRFTWRGDSGFTRRADAPLVYLTQRSRLDEFLVSKAVEAGVSFFPGARVESIAQLSDGVTVVTGDETFEAAVLIGADGANGPVANSLGFGVQTSRGIALEGNYPMTAETPGTWNGMVAFDFGDVAGGYGWAFPKADHVNIGVGGWRSTGPQLRTKLAAQARRYGFDPSTARGVKGHHLPVRKGKSPLWRGRVMLAGDAAGLVDPLTGEGIYAAIYSGCAAARAAASLVARETTDLSGYERELNAELIPELAAGRYMHGLFHVSPRLFFNLARRRERVWRLVAELLVGERSYLYVKRRLGRLWPVAKLAGALVVLRPGFRRAR